MPIFMDRHDIPGVNAKDVAKAHQEDLKIQKKFDCKALTYWFDEDKGMAFCLIEAPNKESVQELHNYAHGLIPNEVIEVESNIVESFLGRIKDPVETEKSESAVINDPAFRTIMVFYLNPVLQIASEKMSNTDSHYLDDFTSKLRNEFKRYNGLEVEHTNDCFMASFVSSGQAISCALAMRNYIEKVNGQNQGLTIQLRIGVSAGVPVSKSDALFFGPTIKLARQLGMIARDEKIMVSSVVNDLHQKQAFNSHAKKSMPISSLKSEEEDLLNLIMDTMEEHACDPSFDVNGFCSKIGMSKSQLYRKVTALTGHSPNDFIKEFRLRKAFRSIEKQDGNVGEIAFESGFSSLSYFSKCFQKRFGVFPSYFTGS